jgi:hypothetical protein
VAPNPRLPVVEHSITPDRSGWYKGMSGLTSVAVQQKGIKPLWVMDLPGDYRGSEHAPLIIPSVPQREGGVCDIALFVTMSCDIYCFDASKPDPTTGRGREIWKARIGNPINLAQYDVNGTWKNPYDMYPINRPYWGGASCPYVDMNTMTMYVCVPSSPDGTMPKIRYYLHAIDLTTGKDKVPPLDISKAVYQSPGGAIAHDAMPRKQRAGLAFCQYKGGTQDIIFICDSTFAMMNNGAHGFILACDVTGVRSDGAMSIAACTTSTAPPYAGGGVWMAGGAPVVAANGDIIVVVGNGAFDPTKHCYGNSVWRLRFNPENGNVPASFSSVTHACWYTDAGRTGKDPTIPWIGLIGDFQGQMDGMNMTAPNDQDLGCAQGRFLPKTVTGFTDDLFIDCGKDGVAHMVLAGKMPEPAIGDFAPDKIQALYDKALCITGATYYPGDFDITPTNLGQFSTTVDGFTHHQHSTPPYYASPDHGILVYYGGENGAVRAFQIKQLGPGKYTMAYLATGQEFASAGVPAPGGMPGSFMSISSAGTKPDTAILWAQMPLNADANKQIAQGRLVLYGANWINGTDPNNKTLIKIWDSADWAGLKWDHCKFAAGHPALDKYFMATYDAQCWVWGLAS